MFFGSTELKTKFVSDTELTAIVPAASIVTAGTVSVSAQTTDFYTNTVPFSIVSREAVSVFPASVSLGPKGIKQFTSSSLDPQSSITWSIQEAPSGGSITSTGLYTAPATSGVFHVIASPDANPSDSAIAIVTVLDSGFSPTGSMHSARAGHSEHCSPMAEY